MSAYDKDTNPNFRPSRSEKKTIVFYTSRKKSDQLRILAIKEGTSLQALCELATDQLLAKHGIVIEDDKKEAKEKKAVG